jgi:hypothetical protein
MVSNALLDLCLRGRTATAAELASAEEALVRNPADARARALLLGGAQPPDRYRHVLWFIEHQPQTWLLSFSTIPADHPAHPRGAELWARSVETSSGRNVSVVVNAARYHFFTDPEKAEAIMLSLQASADGPDSRAAIANFYGEWHAFLSASLRETDARAIGARALAARASSFARQPPVRRLAELAALGEHARYASNPDFGRLRELAAEETRVALSVGDAGTRDCYLHSAAGLLYLAVSSLPSAVAELTALPAVQVVAAVRLPYEAVRAGLIDEALTFVARCEQAQLDTGSLLKAIELHGSEGS